MSYALKNQIKKNFTIIPNELINDPNLSDRAKFLFIFLASQYNTSDISLKNISVSIGVSRETVQKYLRELEKVGWLEVSQIKADDGKFSGLEILVLPQRKKTAAEKNRSGKIPLRIPYYNIYSNTNNNKLSNYYKTIYMSDSQKTQKKSSQNALMEKVVSDWNDFAQKHGLAQVLRLSDTRRRHLKKRFKEPTFLFDSILKSIEEQPALIAGFGNDRSWTVNFDWIIKNDSNYIRVLERRYAPKKTIQKQRQVSNDDILKGSY